MCTLEQVCRNAVGVFRRVHLCINQECTVRSCFVAAACQGVVEGLSGDVQVLPSGVVVYGPCSLRRSTRRRKRRRVGAV